VWAGDACREAVSLGTLVRVPAGSFGMGSPETESGRSTGETLVSVRLSEGFLMMESEAIDSFDGMKYGAADSDRLFGVEADLAKVICPLQKGGSAADEHIADGKDEWCIERVGVDPKIKT
jgi:hypothetical protein